MSETNNMTYTIDKQGRDSDYSQIRENKTSTKQVNINSQGNLKRTDTHTKGKGFKRGLKRRTDEKL